MISVTNYGLVTLISVLDTNITRGCLTSNSVVHTSLLDTHHCSSSQNSSIILPGRVEEGKEKGCNPSCLLWSTLYQYLYAPVLQFSPPPHTHTCWPGYPGLQSSSYHPNLESSWNPRSMPPLHQLTCMTRLLHLIIPTHSPTRS